MRAIRLLAVGGAVVGMLMHAYVCFVAFSGDGIGLFNVGLFAFAGLPYLIGLLAARRWPGLAPGILAALAVALASDARALYGVFWAPTSSTESLVLLIAPVFNLLAVLLGLLLAWAARWLWSRYRRR